MKKIIPAFLLLVFAGTMHAQTPKGHVQKTPEERATFMATHLEKSLTLTADQKTKVHDLVLVREQKIDQLREQNKGKDRCAWSDQRKQAQDEFNAGMQHTLTPDQYTKWAQQKEERSKQRANHHPQSTKTPEQRADGFAAHLEKDLSLTAEQKTKVRELMLNMEQSNDKLREQYKGQDPCAWSSQRKQVHETFDNGMKTALTPEQYQKWQDQKKQGMEQHKNKKQASQPNKGNK